MRSSFTARIARAEIGHEICTISGHRVQRT